MGKEFGKWEVIETLPEGGQAWVYLVKEKESSSEVRYVLKRLKNPNRLDRFNAEVEALQNLNHPSIAKLIDFDVHDKNPWFVQEYYHGGDLDKFVKKNGPLDHNKALNFLIDIASSLEYAHSSGKLHRDIKPANIFLQDQNNGPAVLGDFGLAWKAENGERLTLTDEAVGSFHYMAPELADGRVEAPTWHCDIYSLGKVLYFMLSGGRMFDREIHRDPKWDLVKIRKDIRLEHINNLLDHMITYDPADRMAASRVVRESTDLKRIIDGGYAPLTGSTISRCKYCGLGYYHPVINSDEQFMSFWGFASEAIQGSNRGWRAMACDVCGHMEFFRMDVITPHNWWPEKK